ncbi:cytochrome c oxidase accessory protein CcoG [Ramlibacter alkalitolerans]|uniref:Cytochrome c oxidase accessory protein CcoG n=1 Tax=Ramlibacter alkalitolerans TaxID=2039631 RepID=A0ABS1JP34_9BURK|nr:cytochrome c oxidase accessory protein CcoG [Ramlibacter alkalitolerans]MBL0426024.1 cytochrome c oxidase accessory protein CcoG [Ramlibacter alkalitolerans]
MKVIPITPVQAAPDGQVQGLYASESKVYPRSVTGTFARWRWAFVWLTQIIFYGLPWLQWGDRQAVLFDLGARRFYILGYVLYPQDFIYLTGLLVISALSLFLFTAVAGRLWCGFACPQTVYTEMFLWIERKVEGERGARMKLDAAGMDLEKLVKKSFKHLLWGMVAMWTGFTFVGYFTPITELGMEFLQTRMGSWEVFWVFFYAFATYGNAGFMREQVCKYMCPYARFQSAMFDRDTLIVSYDTGRGEPRGSRGRKADPVALNLGSCVDCTLCVQVCPTGIDIRKGLQYECIGCGACVDVCDGVMDKMNYARGLIRFSTQNAMASGGGRDAILHRILRPRVLVYASILLVLTSAVMVSLALRTPLKVDVVRDRAALSRIVAGGMLENVYRLQIMNASEEKQHYRLDATGLPGLSVASDRVVEVGATESRWVAVRLQVPYGSAAPGSHPIHFEIDNGTDARVREKSVFLVPR